MGKQAIRVHMDEALLADVDEQAKREDRSRNWTVNDLVRRGLAAIRVEEALGLPPATIRAERVAANPDVLAAPVAFAAPSEVRYELADSNRPKPTRKHGAAAGAEVPQSVRDREASGQPPSPQPPPFAPGAPAASVDTPAGGPPAGSTNAPGKPHRHRYVTEVPGSRQGRAGVIQADFACACGEVKRQAVR